LAEVALQFGPAEYFSLMVLGLVASIVLASGSLLHALAVVVVGLVLGLVGTDVNSGVSRYSLGFPQLADGVGFVVIAMGMFGLAEIISNLEHEGTRGAAITRVKGLLPSREDWGKIIGPISRGTVLGSALGILPGGGAILASFASYSLEKKLSKTPEEFGQGAIEGVAGPEAANNAGAQTSFIPMLTLGIPANPVMALMIGALTIQGIQPGPTIITEQATLFWGVVVSMWIGNVFLLILNLPLIGLWVRMISVPYHLLYPAIMVFCAIGVFSISNTTFDVYLMALFGLLGYVFMKLGCEPTPLLLGFILGPPMEEHLRRAMVLSEGQVDVLVRKPLSAFLLAIAALLLASVLLPTVRKGREETFLSET
jgi:TctA family transporter